MPGSDKVCDDVVNNIFFVIAAILDFHLQGED